jgi:hypothetical protein
MGSASDWETMRHAVETLNRFGVPSERRVVSAHRTPEVMVDFAREARARGVRLIIAGAGGAAHLPGMVASLTLFLIWWDEKNFRAGYWRYALPAILMLLAAMMVSEVRYPTFKKLDWRTQKPFVKTVAIVLFAGLMFLLWQKLLPIVAPLVFTAYLVYGFVRPYISRKMQQEIEHDDDDEGSVS